MTICIAAIAKQDGNEYIIFSTDHMVSTAIGQFEHSIIKYKEINKNTVAMLAGNPLIFDDLVKVEGKDLSYTQIQNGIFDNFKKKRKEIIRNEIFDVYGIDPKFFVEALTKQIPNCTVKGHMSAFRKGTYVLF